MSTTARDKVQQSLSGIQDQIAAPNSGLAQGDIYTVIDRVLSWGTALLGTFALLALIWAGVQYMAAAGNDNQVAQAKKTAFWAVVGIIISVSAYIILEFVFNIFGPSTSSTTPSPI